MTNLAQPAFLKTCPHCGKEIKAKADLCRYCHGDVSAVPAGTAAAAPPKGAKYCQACGTIAKPMRHTKGSFIMEVFMWLLLLVPGVLYSLWRVTSRTWVCPKCGSDQIIPLDSPKARAAMASH